jgi:cobalt-zinc-cadmium efflux system outer membrane protein
MQIRRITALAILILPLLSLLKTAGMAQEENHLTLQSAITIAQQNNPKLVAMHNEIAAAKGRGWTTWWLADPAFSVEWEGVPRGAGLGKFGERKVALSQRIEFPTNILWRNRLAGREVEITKMRYEHSRIEIRAAVIVAYFQYLAARDALSLAGERVGLSQQFVDKADIRRQVGEYPAIEMVRTRVELARAQNELQNVESAFESTKARLNAVLGRSADAQIIASDSLVYQSIDLSLFDIKQQAQSNHPQLREADARVGAANNLRKLAWGTLLPSIEISGFQQNIEGKPEFYGAEIGFSVPLWFAFRQRGEIEYATASLASEESQRTQIRLQLLADIEAAYSSFKAAKSQLENFATTLLNQADEVYRIALRSYEEGEVGYLQLLEAQQTLIEVRQSHIEVLANYNIALAALEKASAVIILR